MFCPDRSRKRRTKREPNKNKVKIRKISSQKQSAIKRQPGSDQRATLTSWRQAQLLNRAVAGGAGTCLLARS
eukprot:6213285-Pleurochrysis_carterae.AAC.2